MKVGILFKYYLSVLIERKGFEYLIKAMPYVLKEHENARLIIVGSGPLETKLKNLFMKWALGMKWRLLRMFPMMNY